MWRKIVSFESVGVTGVSATEGVGGWFANPRSPVCGLEELLRSRFKRWADQEQAT